MRILLIIWNPFKDNFDKTSFFTGIVLTLTIGILTWLGNKLAKYLRIKDADSLLRHREKIREQANNIFGRREKRHQNYGNAILRDTKRLDAYPNINPKDKSSAWSKIEIKGWDDSELEIFAYSIDYYRKTDGDWKKCSGDDEGSVKAYPVGRISYDRITKIDDGNDKYYALPQIYCSWKCGTPFSSICLYILRGEGEYKYLEEINTFRLGFFRRKLPW